MILILSFVPNSASVEQLFSKLGDIKTKKRNRMGTEKLRDTAFVKSELHRHQATMGTARKCLKRHFGNNITATDSDPTGSRMLDEETVRDAEDSDDQSGSGSEGDNKPAEEETQPFSNFARRLEAAVMADDEDAETDDDEVATPSTSTFTNPHVSFLIIDLRITLYGIN